ncbi:MAG: class I SAM-dependent methyltransferase [Spirochaetales bacterium]|nr:class I SAM-dependent methyltransferase [Spirochaetales bacterium]
MEKDNWLETLTVADLPALHEALLSRFGVTYARLCAAITHKGILLEGRINRDSALRAIRYALAHKKDRKLYFISDCLDDSWPALSTTDAAEIRIELSRAGILEIADLSTILSPQTSLLLVVCNSDQFLLEALRHCHDRGIAYLMPQITHPAARYFERNDRARQILREESRLPLKKFDLYDFEMIIQALEITRKLPGDYLEIGVYQGRSARVALSYMRAAGIQRKSYFLDTFSGFDYPEAREAADSYWAGRHGDGGLTSVSNQLSSFQHFELVQSNIIRDALPAAVSAIALANIDVDLYDATRAALSKVSERLVPGGIMIVEDAGHTPLLGGAFLATEEFLEENADFYPVQLPSGQCYLIRMS